MKYGLQYSQKHLQPFIGTQQCLYVLFNGTERKFPIASLSNSILDIVNNLTIVSMIRGIFTFTFCYIWIHKCCLCLKKHTFQLLYCVNRDIMYMSTSFQRIALCVYFYVGGVYNIQTASLPDWSQPFALTVCSLLTLPVLLHSHQTCACEGKSLYVLVCVCMCTSACLCAPVCVRATVISSWYDGCHYDLWKSTGWEHKNELIVSRAGQQIPCMSRCLW